MRNPLRSMSVAVGEGIVAGVVKTMLKISNLHASVEGKPILKGVDLVVRPGEVQAIMGPNGSGKSTLAYVLAGHPKYEVARNNEEILRLSGSSHRSRRAQDDTADLKSLSAVSNKKPVIKLDGHNLLEMPPDQRAKVGLFLAFQYPVSVGGVTVEQLLRKVAGGKRSALQFRKDLVAEAKKLGIKEELLRRSINEGFSGGEKKRLEILQLSILKPKYAILDETDSGLDVDALRSVAKGIMLSAKRNTGIIVITHYQRILKYIKPDKVHVMIDGRIIKSGTAELAEEVEKKGYK